MIEASAPTIQLYPIRTIDAPTCIIPPILRRMPFLTQPSQFIPALDRHQYAGLHTRRPVIINKSHIMVNSHRQYLNMPNYIMLHINALCHMTTGSRLNFAGLLTYIFIYLLSFHYKECLNQLNQTLLPALSNLKTTKNK